REDVRVSCRAISKRQVQQRALQRAALPVIFVSAAVANRVSNRVLLAPLLKHTYFLALTTTIAQLAAYVGWLQLRLRKGLVSSSMWSFAKRNPALIAAFGLCEGAFFPLVFYSAARLPGSLVQVLNQTLIPSTVVLSILFLRKRYDAVQIIGVVAALAGVAVFTSFPQSSGSFAIVTLCVAAYGWLERRQWF
ncbi:Protein CLT3, partial [Durusdinium trenchii]